MDDDRDFDGEAPEPPAVSLSTAPARLRAALRELVDERNRYREALVAIYGYRREHTGQPAHVAWHALLVEIPELCRVALEET